MQSAAAKSIITLTLAFIFGYLPLFFFIKSRTTLGGCEIKVTIIKSSIHVFAVRWVVGTWNLELTPHSCCCFVSSGNQLYNRLYTIQLR